MNTQIFSVQDINLNLYKLYLYFIVAILTGNMIYILYCKVDFGLRPRMWHMACSYHIEHGLTDVLLFGGNKHRESKSEKHVMADLTVFSYGKHQCTCI